MAGNLASFWLTIFVSVYIGHSLYLKTLFKLRRNKTNPNINITRIYRIIFEIFTNALSFSSFFSFMMKLWSMKTIVVLKSFIYRYTTNHILPFIRVCFIFKCEIEDKNKLFVLYAKKRCHVKKESLCTKVLHVLLQMVVYTLYTMYYDVSIHGTCSQPIVRSYFR